MMSKNSQAGMVAALLLTVAINGLLIGAFHDRGWIPADDGHYAHVAERLGSGQVLNRDVEELHPGAVHLIHALALKGFGDKLVSLRYPLAAVVLLQSLLVFWLFARWGPWRAAVAATAVTCLGPFQVTNPTTSLYSLFFTVVLVAVLLSERWSDSRRYVFIGATLMAIFLFRQLSAVFVGMGALILLLLEHRDGDDARERGASRLPLRVLMAVSIAGLAGYLAVSTDWTGFLLLGVWPLGVFVFAWNRARVSARRVAGMLGAIAAGAVLAASPMVLYHAYHGSTVVWLRDVFVRAPRVLNLEHIDRSKYFDYLYFGIEGVIRGDSFAARINGIYWCLLLLLAAALGAGLWRALRQKSAQTDARLLALPIIALFNALVSLFNQIPYYLYLSCGLSLVALLWLRVLRYPGSRLPFLAAAALCAVGVYYHAGQPVHRTTGEIAAGFRYPIIKSSLERSGLWIDPAEDAVYRQLVETVRAHSAAGEPIFVFPNNAEVYFLADRPNRFRLFNPTLSLVDEREVDAFIARFGNVKPRVLVHGRDSAYNTDLTRRLLAGVKEDYALIAEVGEFAIFGLRAAPDE